MGLPQKIHHAVVSRIKTLANLNIAEMRLPQDGHIKLKVGSRAVELRVSTLPSINGEKVVLRVLDKESLKYGLEELGFNQKTLEIVRQGISKPAGLILAAGPSSSGKTTTLYAILRELNSSQRNIVTAEDPIEYTIPGINQSQMNPTIGLEFKNALRYYFRQDPDIVMVGEIRDEETAQLATKGAITGHLILSTLHTNDAPSAIVRLFNLGVEPFLLSEALVMVISQRLLRRLCPKCKRPKKYSLTFLTQLGLSQEDGVKDTFFKAEGCEMCGGSGYFGRIPAAEVFLVSPSLRELIYKKASLNIIKEWLIQKERLVPIFKNALQIAQQGITSLEEVIKCQLQE
jgi:type II secretory ATPase GspE/PulE/Tfp pilus assembly ATPase PilB-like protein